MKPQQCKTMEIQDIMYGSYMHNYFFCACFHGFLKEQSDSIVRAQRALGTFVLEHVPLLIYMHCPYDKEQEIEQYSTVLPCSLLQLFKESFA